MLAPSPDCPPGCRRYLPITLIGGILKARLSGAEAKTKRRNQHWREGFMKFMVTWRIPQDKWLPIIKKFTALSRRSRRTREKEQR
jgi:hypothetical protein